MATNVLILCTHNSARSVLAEAMLNFWATRLGKEVRAYSAGSAPRGQIHPDAVAVLQRAGIDTSPLRSKSWDEFARSGAPPIRIVITVCDSAAEQCPYWPGNPLKVHWGYSDPSSAPERARNETFELTRQAIAYRMRQLAELPLDRLTDAELRTALESIAAR